MIFPYDMNTEIQKQHPACSIIVYFLFLVRKQQIYRPDKISFHVFCTVKQNLLYNRSQFQLALPTQSQ